MLSRLVIIALIAITLVTATSITHDVFAKSPAAKKANKKAKSDILSKLGKALEGNYTNAQILTLKKFTNPATVTFYNKTKGTAPTPPGPQCKPDEHLENGVCVKNNPGPGTTNASFTKICAVGDLSGNKVPAAMTKQFCDYKVGLGDLGYQKDLTYFKGLNFDKCVIGNHESLEDGSASLLKEALALCGDNWSVKVANGTTLLIGFNTNGKASDETSFITGIVSSPSIMTGVKNVILLSHKNGHVFPNSNHPAEASAIYSQIEDMFDPTVALYEVNAHNHNDAAAANGKWFIAGTGGKSFYSCGTSIDWPYCQNKTAAFLQLTINNDNGAISPHFIDTSGKVIY